MKTIISYLKKDVFLIFAILVLSNPALPQEAMSMNWEGFFMNDFRTSILLVKSMDGKLTGSIRMHAGSELIQDDELSEVSIADRQMKFYIEAKQTRFEGHLSEDQSSLEGEFTFPDGSLHPFSAQRKKEGPDTGDKGTKSRADAALLSEEEMQADLESLSEILKENHPRLYAHTSEAALDQALSLSNSGNDTALTTESFYIIVAGILEKIGCSHTVARIDPDYRSSLEKRPTYLPIHVYADPEGLYYLSSVRPEKGSLQPGCKILSINGRSSGEIRNEILDLISSECRRSTGKYNYLNKNFNFYYFLLDPADAFTIQYEVGTSSGEITLPAVAFRELIAENRIEAGKSPRHSDPVPPLEFHLDSLYSIPMLRIPSFEIRDMEAYLFELDRIFSYLREFHCGDLVLDLRDNAGGHPIFAAQLLSYLTEKEFTYFTRNPEIPDFEALYHPMAPSENHFQGTLFVLVNGGCLSTTGHLLSLIKYHTKAIFIGESPGSTYRCNDFSFQVSLPNSRIEVNIPRTTFITALPDRERKEEFEPDYSIHLNVSDLQGDKDPYLQAVYDILSSKS